eukprot:1235053-Rhodomonas_salina.1
MTIVSPKFMQLAWLFVSMSARELTSKAGQVPEFGECQRAIVGPRLWVFLLRKNAPPPTKVCIGPSKLLPLVALLLSTPSRAVSVHTVATGVSPVHGAGDWVTSSRCSQASSNTG